ncbi:MAG: mechanosensitive ion channel protein MscS [Waddliaceae bacterium]|nr:mechanosensitive ion channel protein MscS [Waddliaceae bacterium]
MIEEQELNRFSSLFETELIGVFIAFVKGAFILLIGWCIAIVASKAFGQALRQSKINKATLYFLDNLLFYAFLTLVAMAALSEMGVDTNSFLTVLGGAALAVGLGLKDQLAQLTAGIVLLVKRPFRDGDYVDIAGQSGRVQSIDFFQTVLKSLDGKKIVLPNSLAMSCVITNFTGYPERRIDIPVLIRYQDSIRDAKAALMEVAVKHEKILNQPEAQVVMSDMADSGIELTLRAWVVPTDYAKVRFELFELVLEAVEGAGCVIPYPHLVIPGVSEEAR